MRGSHDIEGRLDHHARVLGQILSGLDILEMRSRERGEDRTWLAIVPLKLRLREEIDEAADLTDRASLIDWGDEP